ncbi:hypothetical protein H6F42_20685 [Pseudanabaena sp. FACHB-1998]|uniref:hypothetical protein n=1 Tax=Pseudanabaena sp. FACHB-1998 TaxID=2692858 RepID=UPI0016812634|nr:hypothetical protein [Pseudanabaena sp. FACHB-1998]MBD2179345.1 hypothetical protein [Pseudanabaena sp. FACHB-1998]
MPKYTVDEVLDIVKTFSSEEKKDLQNRLISVLDIPNTSSTQAGQSQFQSFGDFTFSGSGSNTSLGINQQMGGESNIAQTNTQTSVQNADLQEALSILAKLKQDIGSNTLLNPVQKATVEVPLKIVEEEAKKAKPDKNIIDQAIAALQKGLEGVSSLAEPVTKVAGLIAKAWLTL